MLSCFSSKNIYFYLKKKERDENVKNYFQKKKSIDLFIKIQ